MGLWPGGISCSRARWRGATVAPVLVLVLVLVLGWASSARAIRLWSSVWGDRYYALDTSAKWTSLLSRAPADTALYPERWSAASLWRARLSLRARPVPWLSAELAYEHRARSVSEGSGAAGGSGVLLAEADAPYRISQLDESLIEVGGTFGYRHELDRAFAAISCGRGQLTVGRQAIGWGRGVLFSAVDIFAPFTPLESDREWRRGIDAIRASIPLPSTFSLEALAAFGESDESSAFAGRVQGYVGDIDGELIVGKRYEDYLYAATVSAPLYDAELHGEVALFRTPEEAPEGGAFGTDDLIAKAVIGGSYSFSVGGELLIIGEYHYSGFGVADIRDVEARLEDDTFRERYVRGDTQILGRHAAAFQASYGIGGGVASTDLSWILSPKDGSAVVSPGLSWIFSDNVTLAGKGYIGYGKGPEDGEIRSEYGATPTTGLIQISFYY
jgi:hypothetical protein